MGHHPREQRVGPSLDRRGRERGIWATHVPFTWRTRNGTDGSGDGDAIPEAAQRPLCVPFSSLILPSWRRSDENSFESYNNLEEIVLAIFLGVALLTPTVHKVHKC